MHALLPLLLAAAAPVQRDTDEILELTTTSTSAIDVEVNYFEVTASTGAQLGAGNQRTKITTATTTTVLAAPAANTTARAASSVKACNIGAAANTVTLKHDKATVEHVVGRATLAPNECGTWNDKGDLAVSSSTGSPKVNAQTEVIGGRSYVWGKTATVTDTAAYSYAYFKDTGRPGAFSLGTPGLNGTVTDCSVVGTAGTGGALSLGTPLFTNASSGSLYLAEAKLTSAVVGTFMLIDVLWYNTGLVVTTTTAQTTTSATLPARDVNGSTNGEGVELALLTTTANTNAAAIATTTASYTDSDGNAGNTATFFALAGFQAPVSPVIGTWMPFNFATSDRGIRALASITLGTSYVAGALSAVLYRPIAVVGVTTANVATTVVPTTATRLYDGSCLAWVAIGLPATTAPALQAAAIQVVER